MKVLCIQDGIWIGDLNGKQDGPKYLEICTVLEKNNYGYKLVGYERTNGLSNYYKFKFFIPLSTIDETEMIRNYQTEKV